MASLMETARYRATVLFCVLASGLPATAAEAEPYAGAGVAIELNKLKSNGTACRAYLVVKNQSGHAFQSLKLDLVMFDGGEVVAKRLAVQSAPLPEGKPA